MAQSTTQPSNHYVSQAGIAAAFASIIRVQWPNLSRVELYALLTRFYQASATLSAQDYNRRRAAAGIRSSFTVPRPPTPTPEHFAKTLDWVYGQGVEDQAAEQRMEGALTRLASQGGRETTVLAVQADPKARAWAREARPNCCYFCAMLATRGAVYASADSAGREANDRFHGGGEFKFHNNCNCIAVPVFGVYEPTAHARQWAAEWQALQAQHGAVSLDLWRQSFGNRATTNIPQ